MTLRNRRSPRVDDRLRSRRIACVKRRSAASAILGLTAFATLDAFAQMSVPSVPSVPGGAAGAGPGPNVLVTGSGQTWRIEPSISGQLYWTDNVNLVATNRQSDFVTQIVPRLVVDESSANTTLTGSISAPILLYANTGSENNRVLPEVSLAGKVQLYPRLFYVDGSIQVTQEFVSPFAPRPTNLVNATNNRYTAQSYSVAPYLKGDGPSNFHYELRDSNIWTNTNALSNGDRAYTNEILGKLTQDPRPFGLDANYDRAETTFNDQRTTTRTEIGRLGGLWQPDPAWRLSLNAGYEDNQFLVDHFSGTTYGGGFAWHPSPRTNLDADAEHRFFGTAYHFLLSERLPLSIWTLRASRDITTYPQQIASLPAQGDVNTLLDSLFSSRITDPAARQAFVDQLISERGLPATLSQPLDLFTEQATLQQTIEGTVNLVGVRNTVLITAYHRRTEPVPGTVSAEIDLLARAQIDNTQDGATVAWSHRITPLYTLTTTADWFRVVANDASGFNSKQGTVTSMLSAALSRLTRVFGGIRYQRFTTGSQQATVEETAVFVGIDHSFH